MIEDDDEGGPLAKSADDVTNRLIDAMNSIAEEGFDIRGIATGARWAAAWFSAYAESEFYQQAVEPAQVSACVEHFSQALHLAADAVAEHLSGGAGASVHDEAMGRA
jgi:hypothetical protein